MRSLPSRPGLRLSGAVAAAAVGAVLLIPSASAYASASAVSSRAASAAGDGSPDQSFTIEDPRITESSGLAASRAHPGIYWTHNDSDDGPYIYAVDSRTGETVATITLRGIGDPRDVEAISIGPDGDVYVGDIGDNLGGSWDHVWIYRFPEPKRLKDATVNATQFTVRYADGPRDAEAMMVDPTTGRVYIASKNENGGGLYEGPARLSSSGTNTFRRIGEVPWVTDGAFSPDGRELLLRSYFSARAYVWKNGRIGADHSVRAPFQGQAESVTYTADGKALMFGSEGTESGVVRVDLGKDTDGGSSSKKGGSSSGGGGGDTGAGAGRPGNTTLGAVLLAGVAALFFGIRRMRRKN
ncbi:WD40 repeat domain-containing protein [Streptomyces sp. AK02-01A]|uniref:WD40 repeat domain-containing protein n=1 Tax=Streptomyces sp. AK02-01A TaxID=3028648 RepID=UPI0029BBC265|nr:WD40 repeat domain-containing protein [Streptomyces sp. AK02-01A]MDX3854654.1 WD40 repeat domain-containing protein [Streptomyces sp. AK02-01A]